MHEKLIRPVVLAGGKGTRLWPLSRSQYPKQFLALTGEFSLFQMTLKRLADHKRYLKPVVITNEDYRFLVVEQALECGVELSDIILEPVARNTAPAIVAAALISSTERATLIHVVASDHNIEADDTYFDAVDTARNSARLGRLATFGIVPTGPATGFGYIEAGDIEESGARTIKRFVEKPEESIARDMLAAGGFYWNSGMFLFRSDVFLEECKCHAPIIYEAVKASVTAALRDLKFIRLDRGEFEKAPDISVDYAIFEKTGLASVVPSSIRWSDLGSWDAVWKESRQDQAGNASRGPVTLHNTRNSLVISEGIHVAVSGVDDLTIVASEDAIYVGKLVDAQGVGAIVKGLMKQPGTAKLAEEHRTIYRPWGGYTYLLSGDLFQVKRLFIKPGQQLSLQKHHHRSEHWVVIRGVAEIAIDEKRLFLSENESTFTSPGAVHRVSNPGKVLLELIEIQTGTHFGEDDTIRFENPLQCA